jgi:hypothetical protein
VISFVIKLVGTRDVRTQSARAQPLPFSSYREKGERRPSSGTRAGVGDSPRKHTGPVPVHSWQRAWFMARDLDLRGETGLRHRPGLILTPAVPHTWAAPGSRQVFLTVRLFDRRHPSLGVWTWDLDWSGLRTRDSVSKKVKVCD